DGAMTMMIISGAIAILGIAIAGWVYLSRRDVAEATVRNLPGLYRTFRDKYYVDEAYDAAIVTPLWRLGQFCYGLDRFFINGLLWIIAAIPRAMGFALQGLQRG